MHHKFWVRVKLCAKKFLLPLHVQVGFHGSSQKAQHLTEMGIKPSTKGKNLPILFHVRKMRRDLT